MTVDKSLIVMNEAMVLTTAMRKSERYMTLGMAAILGLQAEVPGQDTESRMSPLSNDTELVLGLTRLCVKLSDSNKNFSNLSALDILSPFTEIVQSQRTSGSLTTLALGALEKFLALEIVGQSTPDVALAMRNLTHAVTHCRFEASDASEDDAVLQLLLVIMDRLVNGNLGHLLSHESICEIVETCLSMTYHTKRGDALRRTVISTLVVMVRTLFGSLPFEPNLEDEIPLESLPLGVPEAILGGRTSSDMLEETLGSSFSYSQNSNNEDASVAQNEVSHEVKANEHNGGLLNTGSEPQSDDGSNKEDTSSGYRPGCADPYGPAAVAEVFRIFVSIVNPFSTQAYSDSMRIMVLVLLRVCFEAAGPAIANHPAFVDICSVHLFKYLAQLVRLNNPALVSEALQLVQLLVKTDGVHYKPQIEFIFVYLLTQLAPHADLPREADLIFYQGVPNRPKCVRIAEHPSSAAVENSRAASPVPSKSPEICEIMVEFIARIVHSPSFFSFLFANFDCDVQQVDLCEDLVSLLCRSAYPDSATWSTASVPPLCLESVLCLLQSLTSRPVSESQDSTVEDMIASKSRKAVEIMVAEQFNRNPKKGVAAAIQHGTAADTPTAIAEFLRTSRRLNKTTLGRYLAKSDHLSVLKAYISGFDFSNKRIDEALREFLCCFRLPGESQEIEPIFENFSSHYVKCGGTEYIKSPDAAFILCYAIIMLNTDQHSPQVKKRMSFESFKNNLRGANDNENFDELFLKEIYTTIKHREIILPDEHDNGESFEYSWHRLLLQLPIAGNMVTEVSTSIDSHVFRTIWRPVASTLSFVFVTATDDLVFSRVISGFHRIAQLATRFSVTEALDHIIEALAHISTLSSGNLQTPTDSIEVDVEGVSVIVSDLSVPFGSDLKAQMASITLFRIILTTLATNGAIGPTGWSVVFKALTNLYLFGLDNSVQVEPIKPCYTFKRSKTGRNIGIFSALSTYLTSSSDIPDEPTDQDVEAALGAKDCVQTCSIPTVIATLVQRFSADMIEGVSLVFPPCEEEFTSAICYLSELLLTLGANNPEFGKHVANTLSFLAGGSTETRYYYVEALKRSGNAQGILEAIAANPEHDATDLLLELDGSQAGVWDFLRAKDPESAKRIGIWIKDNIGLAPEGSMLRAMASIESLLDNGYAPALETLDTFKSKDFDGFMCTLVRASAVPDLSIRGEAIKRVSNNIQEKDFDDWTYPFTEWLLPLLDELLRPEVFKRDSAHMDSTRQQAASIVCKCFLHFVLSEDFEENSQFQDVWERVFHAFNRFLTSRRSQWLTESISEMAKNAILVLKVAKRGTPEFWACTAKAVNVSMPELVELANQ